MHAEGLVPDEESIYEVFAILVQGKLPDALIDTMNGISA